MQQKSSLTSGAQSVGCGGVRDELLEKFNSQDQQNILLPVVLSHVGPTNVHSRRSQAACCIAHKKKEGGAGSDAEGATRVIASTDGSSGVGQPKTDSRRKAATTRLVRKVATSSRAIIIYKARIEYRLRQVWCFVVVSRVEWVLSPEAFIYCRAKYACAVSHHIGSIVNIPPSFSANALSPAGNQSRETSRSQTPTCPNIERLGASQLFLGIFLAASKTSSSGRAIS